MFAGQYSFQMLKTKAREQPPSSHPAAELPMAAGLLLLKTEIDGTLDLVHSCNSSESL